MSKKINGIGASSGVAIAKIFKLNENEIEINENKIENIEKEIEKFDSSINFVVQKIQKIKEKALLNLGEEEANIFNAHIQIASDPIMLNEIKNLIKEKKYNALFATNEITNKYFEMFQNMEDEYMKERASDIKDVSKRIMNDLAGLKMTDVSLIDEEVIIVAKDLTPSDTAQLNKKFVKGFITDIGGRTSHAAIMARTLEIPAILGLNNITKETKENDFVAIDGDLGSVWINPSEEEKNQINKKAKEIELEKKENEKFKGKASKTIDNHEVEIASNIGAPKDTEKSNKNDAEGIGLFRSEFLYMDAQNWPTEEEQFEAYKKVLQDMNNKRVVVRTLDIGGDKTLKYYKFPEEMNPFLGYRAIRFTLDRKEIFQTQLKALLKASVYGKLAIMFPMIATIDEFLKAKKEVEIAKKELKEKNIDFSKDIEIGMMVEIPSVAVISDKFAKYADFFSIGTNDLMQYTMAADRMNENVSYLYQPLNPSILNLIKLTIDGAHKENKWVGMCGEMAGNKEAIPILLGLGLDEFSMSATSVLSTRRQISQIKYSDAKKLAQEALNCSTEKEVKELVKEFNNNIEK